MFSGKMKAVTFSYDDGVTQDIRLIEILNKYGLKATFNLNSELLGVEAALVREGVTVDHNKVQAKDVRSIYDGHEIAAHTLTHPTLTRIDDAEVIRQVEQDRLALSELVGYEVRGFAYPGGGVNYDGRISDIIQKNTGVRYCRTTVSTHSFDLQSNLYEFKPTVYHHMEFDKAFELAQKFISVEADTPQLLYIWGHSYELDIRDEWGRFEELCKMISGHKDVYYGTNSECLLRNQ